MRELDPPNKPGATTPDQFLDEPDRLLGELQSIKDLLQRELGAVPAADIPLLEPLQELPPQRPLLDIDGIFSDDFSDNSDDTTADSALETASPAFQFPKFTLDVAISDDPLPAPPTTTATSLAAPPPIPAPTIQVSPTSTPARGVRPNYDRELLIQELVDEFIPQIEAALHERLGQLDNDALQALKKAD